MRSRTRGVGSGAVSPIAYAPSSACRARGSRSQVHGTETADQPGYIVIHAEIPAHELSRYPIDLRSVSHGTGSFTRRFVRYDYMPTALGTANTTLGLDPGRSADPVEDQRVPARPLGRRSRTRPPAPAGPARSRSGVSVCRVSSG